MKRPKGFGYAEFATVEGLKKALALDGVSFQGRSIKIRIADPRMTPFPQSLGEHKKMVNTLVAKDRDRGGGDSTRDFGDWTRKGPLPDLPSRGNDRRSGPSDFADRRPPRETPIDEKPRDFGNWERKGPLSPLPQQERPAPAREGSRPRTNEGQPDSMRSNRRLSPAAWGEGRQEGSRPPRRDAPDRPERVPSAADRDMQWRSSMRPDAPGKSPTQSRSGSEAPPSPAPAVVVPAMRPKLNLTKRTVSDAPDVTSPALTSAGESKASPFGAARPIDTAAREREIEEKRLAAIKEKKDADDKAKEERRAAKEAVVEEAAVSQQTEALANAETETGDLEEDVDGGSAPPIKRAAEAKPDAAQDGNTDEAGDAVQSVKTRATESGNWRHPSGEQRGGRGSAPGGPRRGSGATRGGRAEAARPARANGGSSVPVPQTQTLPVSSEEAEKRGPDEEGWERVPTNKGRRNQKGRPAS